MLTEKFSITKQGAYYHFNTKEEWLPQYSGFDADFAFAIRQRFNYIYREATFQYLHAQNDNAKVGYLRVMLEANSKCSDFTPDLPQQNIKYELSWKEKEEPFIDFESMTVEERKIMAQADEILSKHMTSRKRESIH
jgi:hypothetical protein